MLHGHAWQAAIQGYGAIPNMHVIVGDGSGELLSYQKGSAGLDTEMRLFSGSSFTHKTM